MYRYQHDGWTLIELIVVVVLISIIGTYSYFSMQSATINLGAQASQLASDIRYAQAQAMTKGQRYRWVKTSSTTYQIQNSTGMAIPLAQGSTTAVLGTGIVFGSIVNLPNSLINFDGQGTPYVDTSVPGTALSSNATIALVSGSETRTVTIAAGTGSVSVQ